METFLEIVRNYLVFTIITIILILALIGYLVENNIGKDVKIKKRKNASEDPPVDSI